jgi:N-acyl-D-amino-acid deacylase
MRWFSRHRTLAAGPRCRSTGAVRCFCAALVLLLGAALAPASDEAALPPPGVAYDVIIRNGHVLDGSGNPWFAGDIAIRGDRIVKIGRHLAGAAKRTIDAKGLTVAPGFIDMHSHSEYTLLVDGNAESKIRQGVTTEIVGEASSVAPVCPAVHQEGDLDLAELGIARDWNDLDGYYRRLLKQGSSVNVASYVATGSVRLCGMGPAMRAPAAAELEKMKTLVADAMRQGAIGLSTGLIYPPGSYARTDEVVALARVASQYGGIYTSHLRNEGPRLLEAVQEAITIGEQANIPIHILHIKATGENSSQHMKDAVALIENARARGLEIGADQYPYIASSTGLTTRLPTWVQDGGREQMLSRLRDPETRARIRAEVERANHDPTKMIISSLHTAANQQFEGHTIAEVARARNQDPTDTIFDLLLEEGGHVGMIFFTMREDDVRYAMRQPWVSIGSDGSAVSPNGILGRNKPHPRFYGTHARVLGKYVRDEHVLTLEDAVRKMTALAAEQIGIRDRGLLREGFYADVVIFDPARIADKATFENPHQYAQGVDTVLVNGKVVIQNGAHTGARPGMAIYGAGR